MAGEFRLGDVRAAIANTALEALISALHIHSAEKDQHMKLQGIIGAIDPMDAGRRLGISFKVYDGRKFYLFADVAQMEAIPLRLELGNAANMGDLVEVDVEFPDMPRLGAPAGRVLNIRTVAFAGVDLTLKKAA